MNNIFKMIDSSTKLRVIRFYKENECLWHFKSPDNNNKNVKRRLMKNIAIEMNKSVEELARIWNSLLGTFRIKRKQYRNLENIDMLDADVNCPFKKWKYFDEMKFLEENYAAKDLKNFPINDSIDIKCENSFENDNNIAGVIYYDSSLSPEISKSLSDAEMKQEYFKVLDPMEKDLPIENDVSHLDNSSNSDILAFPQAPIENSTYHTVMGILCNLEELESLDYSEAHNTKIQLMELNLKLVKYIQDVKYSLTKQ